MRDNWKEYLLEDVVECLDGRRIPLKKEDREKLKGSYPYYGASGIIDYVNDYIFDEDLILLGEDGENVVSRNLPLVFKISGKNWVNNHAHVLRPKGNHDLQFLVYLLENRDYLDIVSGSAQPKINQQNLMKLGFRVPQPKTQRKIAHILSTCDDVIEQTEAAIAKYQALKQGMMHDLFTRGIDLKTGQLRPTYEAAPDLYKESVLGWIPRDWEVETIDNVASLRHGYQFRDYDFVDEGIDVVKIGQVGRNGNLDLRKSSKINHSRLEEFAGIQLFNGDILMALTGATLGKTAMIKNTDKPLVQNYRVGYFDPKDSKVLDKLFLYYLLIGDSVQNEILGFVNAGAQGNIGKADFEKISIVVPNSTIEQDVITKKISSLDSKIETEQSTLAKYQQLKAGLMQDLLTGKVEVG
jgi:type I restriction enzyme S subunit